MELATRLAALEALLRRFAPLWQAQPFKQTRPEWCEHYPDLSQALLALDDQQLDQLGRDEAALWSWLANRLPPLGELVSLCQLPSLQAPAKPTPGPHFANHIPGRKWQQIEAFAAAVDRPAAPLLEWCGGKGHLGRLLAWQHQQTVSTLERDPQLCRDGEQLAGRTGVVQHFLQEDALTEAAHPHLAGRHVVALHACGELHRQLLRQAVAQRLPAIHLAPCCYHHLNQGDYRPLSQQATLVLPHDALRLAVTGAVTAPARELRLRDREMAWKLGYLSLWQDYRPLRPIDKAWLKGRFADFCRQLAAREGDTLPTEVDWLALEQAGWQRQREVMRLSLPRQGLRRAIELYLVLDMACYLVEQGYQVVLSEFCATALTPRNLLLSAVSRGVV